MSVSQSYDPRYAFVTCSRCRQRYQRIDYGCARHALTCGYPLPEQVEPKAPRSLTSEEWEEFDRENLPAESLAIAHWVASR